MPFKAEGTTPVTSEICPQNFDEPYCWVCKTDTRAWFIANNAPACYNVPFHCLNHFLNNAEKSRKSRK